MYIKQVGGPGRTFINFTDSDYCSVYVAFIGSTRSTGKDTMMMMMLMTMTMMFQLYKYSFNYCIFSSV